MKKSLLVVVTLAACIFASCSNDELLNQAEVPQPYIGFDAFSDMPTCSYAPQSPNAPARAAKQMTNDYLKTVGFNVWGAVSDGEYLSTVFNKQAVTWNASTSKWEYSPLRYWVAGNDYAFTAIAPMDSKAYTYTPNPQLLSLTNAYNGVIEFNQAKGKGETDLVWAFSTVDSALSHQAPVELTFKHLLSRVNFRFTNNFPTTSSVIKVSNVKLRSAQKGTLTLNNYQIDRNPEAFDWALGTDGYLTTTHTFNNYYTSDYFASSTPGGSGATSEAFILPTTGIITITFTVDLYNKDGETYTQLSPENGWTHTVDIKVSTLAINKLRPGYSYTFVAELNQNNVANEQLMPIEFSPTVSDWTDYSTNTYTIPDGSVYIVEKDLEVTVGKGSNLKLRGLPEGVDITYHSENEYIATAADGYITGVDEGKTNIILSAEGYATTTIHVTVTAATTGGSQDGDDNDG